MELLEQDKHGVQFESPRSPEEDILERHEMASTSPLLGGSNMAEFVKLKDDGEGVFKRKENEFAGVTELGTGYKRERSAYLVSLFLGFDFVPPTVVRSIEGSIGSLQRYVHDSRTGYELNDKDTDIDSFWRQRSKMVLFDFIVANGDRNRGNFLLDTNGKLWAIDHGCTFRTEGVLWDCVEMKLDNEAVLKIKELVASPTKKNLLRTLLLELLTEEEVAGCIRRLEKLSEIIADNRISKEAAEAAETAE